MILIADSGSTKTDWLFAEDASKVERRQTPGINPVHMSEEEVVAVISALDCPRSPHAVYFYGAGCIDPFKTKVVNALGCLFPDADVSVESDLLGAARAVCGHSRGIACILGTGSNSCLFDGEKILDNTPPLGYILGDEGSGAVMGRNFLGTLCKGLFPSSLTEEYHRQTGLSTADIIQRVYREPLPNRFLAQTTRFIHQHLDDSGIRQFVVDNFRAFFRRNLVQYHRPDLPVRAIGSVAYYFCEQLAFAAAKEGFAIDRVEKSPMEGLISYHNF